MAEQEQLNIYQKLAKIRKQVEVIQKNKRGYGYTYVSEEEILAKITVFMDKYHLSLVPGIVGGTTKVEPYPYKKTKTTKGGEIYEENVNEVLVSADMTWTCSPQERLDHFVEGADNLLGNHLVLRCFCCTLLAAVGIRVVVRGCHVEILEQKVAVRVRQTRPKSLGGIRLLADQRQRVQG